MKILRHLCAALCTVQVFGGLVVCAEDEKPNLLFIMADQLRFDAVRYAQDKLPYYDGYLKIETPSIDRLAESGVVFETAYSVSPICVPSRLSIRTGCTVGRTGIGGNGPEHYIIYSRLNSLKKRIEALESFEQLLHSKKGYAVETLGKWHVPYTQYYEQGEVQNDATRVIDNNFFDFRKGEPVFELNMFPHNENGNRSPGKRRLFPDQQRYLTERDGVTVPFKDGWQLSDFSGFPYEPIPLDSRYGKPTNTTLPGLSEYKKGFGVDGVPVEYTRTAVLGEMSLLALERLAAAGKPFSLSVHHYSPHPPMLAVLNYFDYYNKSRENLLKPASIDDTLDFSAYSYLTARDEGCDDWTKMSGVTAVYYAMVQELDHWVGQLLDKLEETGMKDNTLVIFTSDHGEKLGAHGLMSKDGFLEEEVRVPLVLSFPGRLPTGQSISSPMSQLDLFATILNYLGASDVDNSDGESLRRFIEPGTISWNQYYDEGAVVSELLKRIPNTNLEMSEPLGSRTDFMIRYGNYKLILPRTANSTVTDMLYDLQTDPFEMKNLLGKNVSPLAASKAEFLKILLVEWMKRHSKPRAYYSSNVWHNGEGRGDVIEISFRRTWRRLRYWQSHYNVLPFGPPVFTKGACRRNEYFYIGKTQQGGLLRVWSIQSDHPRLFRVNLAKGFRLDQTGYRRIKVSYISSGCVDIASVNAKITIRTNMHSNPLVLRITAH